MCIVYIPTERSVAPRMSMPASEGDFRWRLVYCACAFLLLNIFAAIGACAKLHYDNFKRCGAEMFVMGLYVVNLSLPTWAVTWAYSFADEATASSSRADKLGVTAVLAIDVGVTILCVCGGVRVHNMVLPVLYSLASYVAAIAIFATPKLGGVANTVIILFVLDIFSLLGARRNEAFLRREWRHMWGTAGGRGSEVRNTTAEGGVQEGVAVCV